MTVGCAEDVLKLSVRLPVMGRLLQTSLLGREGQLADCIHLLEWSIGCLMNAKCCGCVVLTLIWSMFIESIT